MSWMSTATPFWEAALSGPKIGVHFSQLRARRPRRMMSPNTATSSSADDRGVECPAWLPTVHEQPPEEVSPGLAPLPELPP